MYRVRLVSVLVAALVGWVGAGPSVHAQPQRRKAKTEVAQPHHSAVAEAKADLAKSAAEYRTSLEKLLALEESELEKAQASLANIKSLPSDLISRREIEEKERSVLLIQSRVADTRREISEADYLIAEAEAAEQLARLPRLSTGGYVATAALIRFAGTTKWELADAANLEGYFAATFHRPLPVSAYGQTPAHDKLGFDHRNAIDVAVHPDSEEGIALMEHLRSAGIPFIAFRHAVAGSATGAHIHIGYPSRRR
ncbi:MAG TPA: hypothetical protein VKM94_17085 [Blastocatellia bacterium]|nr:hypothetical protein [Blastocatellia bacterium]